MTKLLPRTLIVTCLIATPCFVRLLAQKPGGQPAPNVTALTVAARADFWQARYQLERQAHDQDNKVNVANAAIKAAELAYRSILLAFGQFLISDVGAIMEQQGSTTIAAQNAAIAAANAAKNTAKTGSVQ